MISASAPHAHQLLGHASAGAKHMTLAPPALSRCMAARGGRPPASTTWPTPALEADIDQLVELRVHDDQVDAERPVGQRRVAAISSRAAPAPSSRRPARRSRRPSLIADTRFRSDTQVMAPPMIAPARSREIARPRCHSRSTADGAATSAGASAQSRVQAVGGVQRAQRQLGIFLGDQHADLDLRGRDRVDVDALVGQRREHLLRDAGMAAHADADHRDLARRRRSATTLGRSRSRRWLAPAPPWRASSSARVDGEGQVGVDAVVATDWTIMSTLMLASASGPKMLAATPGRSSTPRRVIAPRRGCRRSR